MSAIGALPRAIAGVDGAGLVAGEVTPDGGLPPTLTIGGNLYNLRIDAATGHPQYVHTADQTDSAGNRLTLEIVLDLAPDGGHTRTQSQALNLASGDSQVERSVSTFNAQGQQTGDTVDSTTREGTGVMTEHTVSAFSAGKEIRRETDVDRTQSETDTKTGESTSTKLRVHGTWENDGQPITASTVPMIDRTEEQTYVTPGEGINKNTDRLLVFTRHGAGPLNALDWDDFGKLVVRFNGHGGDYIERELKVPLGAAGEPDLTNATTVRSEDHQSGLVKGMTQVRIWGGLVSNLAWFGGIMSLNAGGGGLGRLLVGLSAAASGAQLIGEGHALATQRNDGSVARFAMSIYDATMTGLLAATLGRGKRIVEGQAGRVLLGMGALSVAGNATELLGSPLGGDSLIRRLADAKLGTRLASPITASAFDLQWRLEPRFDAGHLLLR